MKKITISLFCLLTAISLFAQAPHSFRYQTVVRNNTGEVLADQNVGLKISILKDSPTGILVFSETFSLITNSLGLINLSVGTGSHLYGSISEIDWASGEYFMRIDVDKNGGFNYEFLGTSQLLSVPYALYAETSGNSGGSSDPYWKRNGNDLYYNDGNVGIGTNSPATRLNLVGSVDDGDERSFIRLKNNSTGPKATVGIALNSFEEKGAAFGYASSNYLMNDLADFGVFTTNGRGFALVAYEGQIRFYTNKNPDNSYSEKMRINEKGYVGIGTTSPDFKLHIVENDNKVVIGYQPAYDGPFLNLYSTTTGQAAMLAFGVAKTKYDQAGKELAIPNWGYIYGNNLNQGVSILPDMQYAPEGVYIKRGGLVGIGTPTPAAKLEIADGDVYIRDINKGIIMTSPNGQCWRGTINNSGVLQFTAIPCP